MRGYAGPETDEFLKMLFFGKKDIGPLGIFFRFANLADIILRPILFFQILCLLLNCNNPISAVLSGSMVPVFRRGDFIISKGKSSAKAQNGNIIIYVVNSSFPQVVHRKIEFHQNQTESFYLTKGDNNNKTDVWLYSQEYWNTSNIDSEVIGVIPWAGYLNILLREHHAILFLWIYYTIYCALH